MNFGHPNPINVYGLQITYVGRKGCYRIREHKADDKSAGRRPITLQVWPLENDPAIFVRSIMAYS
jgi:hypothetical protein